MIVIMMKAIMNVVHTLVFRVSHLSYSDENDEHDESYHEHCMCFVSQDKSCHTAIVIMMKVNMSIVSAFFPPVNPLAYNDASNDHDESCLLYTSDAADES